jgi:opacity protein-like surface antigen
MGVGGGYQNETFTGDYEDTKNSPYFGSIKIGYGDIRAYNIEFVLNYIDNKSKIFSEDDSQRYGLDVMFTKAFNFTKYFYPYARVGFGAGEMKVDRVFEDKISYSSYNVGFGSYIPLYGGFELEINYEYRYTSYKAVDFINEKVSLQSHVNQLYMGVNYRF